MRRLKVYTSAVMILSAALLFASCGADTGDTTEKLQIEPITAVDENAFQTDVRPEHETEETQYKIVADENNIADENESGTDTAGEKNITDQRETSLDETVIYEDVLAQYRDMVQHDFYQDFLNSDDYESHFGKDIGVEIRSRQRNIFYAFYDIDGNGTEELIIAGEEGDVGVSNPAFAPWYYDIYGYDGSKVVSLFPDMELGGRSNFSLHGDGVIEIVDSLTQGEICIEIYKIGNDGVTPELVDRFYTAADLTGEKAVYTYFQNGQTGSEISEEAYRSALHNYETPLSEELHWVEIY